jgi:predicted CoA-binding protein
MIKDETREILGKYRVVAVVGLSRDPSKHSNRVAKYLQSQGYRIIPVNPTTEEVLNEKSYRSPLEVPAETAKKIEIVNVFRPSAEIPSIVDQAIARATASPTSSGCSSALSTSRLRRRQEKPD